MKKLAEKDVPEAWRKLADASLRRLLKTEAKNLVALRSASRAVHHELLGRLGATGTRAGALAALKHARASMKDVVADQILRARARAREAALEQAEAELNRLAEELRKLGYREGIQFGKLSKGEATEDEAHADAVGSSLAARWAQNVLAFIVAAESDEDPKVEFKARLVMQRLDKRIGVIASTETAKAYEDQREDALEDGVDEMSDGKKRKWIPFIFKRWSAVLDRKTCAECADHDGELAVLGGEFSGHEDGPPVHANCRCDTHLIMLPVPVGEDPEDFAEEDGEDE